ncbi:MAG: hypothetical protein HW403_578 [Dehalococcoidia bacterium]|nr:hypothetical protein [Dehalococcoidia bacterium]
MKARQITSVGELGDTFVIKVRSVKEVKKVLLMGKGEFAQIWTVLDAKPFDWDLRRRIFDIEGEILQASSKPFVEFRLINLAEVDEEQRPFLLPQAATVLYERQ